MGLLVVGTGGFWLFTLDLIVVGFGVVLVGLISLMGFACTVWLGFGCHVWWFCGVSCFVWNGGYWLKLWCAGPLRGWYNIDFWGLLFAYELCSAGFAVLRTFVGFCVVCVFGFAICVDSVFCVSPGFTFVVWCFWALSF